MKVQLIILLIVLLTVGQSISQYDFNSCRISNCNS